MTAASIDQRSSMEKDAVGALAPRERRRIGVRLTAGLLALGLLGVGTWLRRVEPDQWQVAEMYRGLATLLVALPTLVSGLRGIVTADARRATDQLVAIAVLAAAASGDFLTATLIPLLLELGRLFEERSSLGARAAIEAIQALAARQAVRWRNGSEEKVDPNQLQPGQVIIVRPGERVAVDGTVLDGRAAIDQSAITGESLHEEVGPGSSVFAGTVVLDGLLRIQVRGAGSESVLGRIVELLAEVERSAVPVLSSFERRAGVWLPFVLTLAGTTLFFTRELSRAIAVLVVATPTALVVAGPAAFVLAMNAAARLRMVIKTSVFFEVAPDVDTLVLDKTGTVTMGTLSVIELRPASGESERTLLAVAAACAFGSLHPVSRAVVAEAVRRGIGAKSPDGVRERPGLGVIAMVDGKPAALGRQELLAEIEVSTEAVEAAEEASQVWVAHGARCIGRIVLRDEPKGEAREALDAVRAWGVERLILLTGDKASIARDVGDRLGVDEVFAELLPAQKLEIVRRERTAGHIVMMVGDGLNDAPALGAADVGVAMGAELNEVALGGADVALLGTDLRRLPKLLALADATRTIIGQNAWLAFGLSALLIALAAFGVLNPLVGALAQSLAVVVIVVNSSRILRLEAPGSS